MLLVATDHFTLEARVEDSLLELVRTRREFECALDVEVEADAIAGIAHGFEVRHGLIFDLRNGASDDRPQLEGALRRFIAMVAMPFERVAVIVSTHTAMHRVARITKDLPDKPLITLNAAQAEDHVRGLKATGTRRRPTSNAALDAVRAETDWARRAPVGRDEELAKTSPPPARPSSSSEALADMSGADLASTFVVDQLAEEVKALCTALDAWAMVREKVIDKLDIRGARAARATAREIRGAMAILRASLENKEASAALYAEIQDLVARGEALLAAPPDTLPARGAPPSSPKPWPHQPRESPPPARRSRNPNRRPSAPSTPSPTAMSRATRRPR